MTKTPFMQRKLPQPVFMLLRFCGSMQLAMILMAVIIVATTVATFIESGFNANVAQFYVYDAPWFYVWLFLLCVNLIAAVLVKYPWRPHQYGFIIVHGGIVIILIGGIIGRVWGMEGNINLTQDGGPQNYLVTGETLLQVKQPDQSAQSFSLPLSLRDPSHERPFLFSAGDLTVEVLDVTRELGVRQVVEPVAGGGVPAVRLVMTGEAVPHPIDRMLVMNHPERGILRLGANSVRFASAKSGEQEPAADTVSRELHFAFAKLRGSNMARVVAGNRSGAAVIYNFDADKPETGAGTLQIKLDGREFTFAVDEIPDGPLPLDGTEWTLENAGYFPDFRMEEGKPVNYSDNPNNPAIVFELSGPVVAAHHDDCCPPEAEASAPAAMAAHGGTHPGGKHLTLRIEQGGLFYESDTPDGVQNGVVTVGESFSPGWGEWDFRVVEFIDSAGVREEIAPMTGVGMRGTSASGLYIRMDNGTHRTERWIRMGTMTTLPLGAEHLHVGFGFRLHPLDFTVNLDRFEVEFNPGTQTPASFKSHVTFRSASGDTHSRAVWMNNPANFPDFPGAGLLGTSYKFSQSSWNPGNLGQTTLQVIRDPGWSLKWIGSLLFCFGLLMVFYLKPYPQFERGKAKAISGARVATAGTVATAQMPTCCNGSHIAAPASRADAIHNPSRPVPQLPKYANLDTQKNETVLS